MSAFKAGQVVRFTYRDHTGAGPDEMTYDFKEVFVLHPNWAGKLHAIDLRRLTPAEREVLNAIMDPNQRGKTHRLPLVNDILRRMNPLEEIKNPMSFYSKFVKVFLRSKDAYRTYYPTKMLSAVIVKNTDVTGKVINPKPLFHKVADVKKEPSRLDMIKQRAMAQKQEPLRQKKPEGVATSKNPERPKVDRGERERLIRQRAELLRAKKPK